MSATTVATAAMAESARILAAETVPAAAPQPERRPPAKAEAATETAAAAAAAVEAVAAAAPATTSMVAGYYVVAAAETFSLPRSAAGGDTPMAVDVALAAAPACAIGGASANLLQAPETEREEGEVDIDMMASSLAPQQETAAASPGVGGGGGSSGGGGGGGDVGNNACGSGTGSAPVYPFRMVLAAKPGRKAWLPHKKGAQARAFATPPPFAPVPVMAPEDAAPHGGSGGSGQRLFHTREPLPPWLAQVGGSNWQGYGGPKPMAFETRQLAWHNTLAPLGRLQQHQYHHPQQQQHVPGPPPPPGLEGGSPLDRGSSLPPPQRWRQDSPAPRGSGHPLPPPGLEDSAKPLRSRAAPAVGQLPPGATPAMPPLGLRPGMPPPPKWLSVQPAMQQFQQPGPLPEAMPPPGPGPPPFGTALPPPGRGWWG
ncbi:unnamed protein product [Phaeothamnion confervicola]